MGVIEILAIVGDCHYKNGKLIVRKKPNKLIDSKCQISNRGAICRTIGNLELNGLNRFKLPLLAIRLHQVLRILPNRKKIFNRMIAVKT